MAASCTPFNKILFGSNGIRSETPSEISSVGSDWSDIRTIALKLGVLNPDDLKTERFKIDRQKLENMIRADGTVQGKNSAEQFFDNIMESTGTYVSWPCRLKVGAKNKKDVHVRIVGKPEDVIVAKEHIMSKLDSRGTRVIMKMDVSYTDHSYIIGRGGNNIKKIMEDTSTHIHFPDSNRSNATEKSNQVSLCGSLEGVERARSLVRLSTPLLISFELPVMAPGKSVPDHDTPYVKEIESQYNVQVIFSTRPKLHSSLVLVKGSEKEAAKVQEATQLLINFTCENIASQILVQMQLEISPQHHEVVRGRNSSNLLYIMEKTKTKIIFPDINDMNIKQIKKSQVTITGTIDAVYRARQQLIGSLPIALIFDYPENQFDTADITNLSNKYGVFITLKHKQRQNIIVVVIKGIEKFIGKVYEARREILKLDTETIKPEIPITYFSQRDNDSEQIYCQNLALLLSNYPETPSTPIFPLSGNSYQSPCHNHNINNNNHNINNNSNSNGNTLNSYQKYHFTPTGICTINSKQLLPQSPFSNTNNNNMYRVPGSNPNNSNNNNCINPKMITNTIHTNNINNNGNNGMSNGGGGNGGGGNGGNGYINIPPLLQSLSPRNNSNNTSGYQSFSSSTNSLEQTYLPFNGNNVVNGGTVGGGGNSNGSGGCNNIPSITKTRYSPDSTFTKNNNNNNHNNEINKGRRMSDGGIFHNVSSEYNNEFGSPHYDTKQQHYFDFDMKRVYGFRAMEQQPNGEVRTPNANWAGLGISHTSPAALETNNNNADDTWTNRAGHLPTSPYHLGVTTGIVDSTPESRRYHLSQHKDIQSLLSSLGLEHYIKTFVINEIDLDIFTTLTEENLIELGITAFGARKRLILAISALLTETANNCVQPSSSQISSTTSSSSSLSTLSRFSGSAAPGAERRLTNRW